MAIYKITNVASNKCLNVHGNNVTTISAGQNVTIWSDSGTNEQRWDVSTLSNNALIRCVINYRYTPYVSSGNNCDLRLIAGNETNSWMNIIKSGNYYKIQNRSTSLYLTVAGTANGSNVHWAAASSTNANYQLWKFDRIAPYEAIPGEDYTYPTNSRTVTNPYYISTNPNDSHLGIDIPGTEGTPVYAFASGFIAFRQESQGSWNPDIETAPDDMRSMGNCIAINHNNPDMTIEPELYTRSIYMHLRDKPAFETGTFVEKGQLIGYIGNTGTSTAPHLHFALAAGSDTNMKPGNTGWISIGSLPHINPTAYLPGYTV